MNLGASKKSSAGFPASGRDHTLEAVVRKLGVNRQQSLAREELGNRPEYGGAAVWGPDAIRPAPVAHGADEADRQLSTRTGLSAVTLEPLRPRAAHVMQLRSIAAVRQGASDGPDNGQEIHRLFPTPISHAGCRLNFGQRMDVVGQ